MFITHIWNVTCCATSFQGGERETLGTRLTCCVVQLVQATSCFECLLYVEILLGRVVKEKKGKVPVSLGSKKVPKQ